MKQCRIYHRLVLDFVRWSKLCGSTSQKCSKSLLKLDIFLWNRRRKRDY